jgi:hypothetical protein
MIQHVTVDHNTHDAVCEAARDAGLSYDQMLAWVVSDWATTYRRRQQPAPQGADGFGVVPSDD